MFGRKLEVMRAKRAGGRVNPATGLRDVAFDYGVPDDVERRANLGYTCVVKDEDSCDSKQDPASEWERTEFLLHARRIEDRRRLARGEATAQQINARNYAWPDPAQCRTVAEPLDYSCLELDLD